METISTLRNQAARMAGWSEGRRDAYYALPKQIQQIAWDQNRDIRFFEKDIFIEQRGYYEYLPSHSHDEDPVFLGTSINKLEKLTPDTGE